MKKRSLLSLTLALSLFLCSCAANQNAQSPDAPVTTTEAVTTPEAKTLKEYDIDDVEFTLGEFPDLEFLNDEQKRAFTLASFVYMAMDLNSSYFFGNDHADHVYNEETRMYHTGFSYESVMKGFSSVLSEDILSKLTEGRCTNLDGEFRCVDGARGASADFDRIKEAVPVEITDEKAVFQLVALYYDPQTEENTGELTFNFEMNLIDGKWKVTKYELWM